MTALVAVLAVGLTLVAPPPEAEVLRPDPAVRAARTAAPPSSVWDRLAGCESGGDWHIDTGNGYSGGLQWHPSTWAKVRPPGAPARAADATRAQEFAAAEALMDLPWGGLHHWPACSRKLGLR